MENQAVGILLQQWSAQTLALSALKSFKKRSLHCRPQHLPLAASLKPGCKFGVWHFVTSWPDKQHIKIQP